MTSHRIVVTGASQGIGAATAEAFASLGSVSIALVSRSVEGLERTAASCSDAGAEVTIIPCDVTKDEQVDEMARRVLTDLGTPTAVINNAGSFEPGGLLGTDASWFRAQVESNLTSAFLVTRAFLPAMIEARQGLVLFMGSTASIKGYPSGAAYCAAKHGLLGLARSVREELAPHGVRVTTLLPGATLTHSWAGTDLPDERFMPASDIAAAALAAYRMSDRAVVEEMLIRPQLGDI